MAKTKTKPQPDRTTTPVPEPSPIHIEDTAGGRAVMSAAAVFLVIFMLLAGLPAGSQVKDSTSDVTNAIRDLTGLTQSWALFAPNPSSVTRSMEARMTYADGSTAVWVPPDNGRFLAPYRAYRWRKWVSRVTSDSWTSTHAPAAAWIARQHPHDGGYPVTIDFYRQSYRAPEAGSGERRDPDPDWNETHYFSGQFEAGADPSIDTITVFDLDDEDDS